jgi:hypothetical protein
MAWGKIEYACKNKEYAVKIKPFQDLKGSN